MNVSPRRRAVGAIAMVAGLVALTAFPTSPAHAADGEWEVLRWSVDPGDDVAGEVWAITGTISAPQPIDSITDVTLTLSRVEEDANCPDLVVPKHVRDGDGDGPVGGSTTTTSTTLPGATSTTAAPTTTTTRPNAGGLDTYRFRFEVSPQCNGHYQLSIVGKSDRPGPIAGSTSSPLPMGDPTDPDNAVAVNLRPPDVTGAAATIGGDRTVTVSWTAPALYASGAPADLVGYGVDYSFDGGTTWVNGALSDPNAHTASFKVKPTDPAGNYQVRVRGVRKNATGTINPPLVAQGGSTAVTTVAVGEPPPTTAPPTTARPRGNNGQAPTGTAPPTTVDEGFDEELDYGDREEGDEDATLPDDATSFLDFVPDSPGSAILVPFAIAECLAVWAFHLRILARRLDGD